MPRLPRYFLTRHGVFYVRKWHKGKMRWKSFGTNRPEALRLGSLWLQRLACERRPDTRPLVANLIREWLKVTGRNEKAKRNASWRLTDHAIPLVGNLSASDITPTHLHGLRNHLTLTLSPESVRNVLADLRTALRFHGVTVNFAGVLPRIVEREPDRLGDETVTAILDAARDPWRWGIVLCLETGIRWGELTALEWRHVNWSRRCLVVEAGKTGKVRRIPLTETCIKILDHGRNSIGPVFQRVAPGEAVKRIGNRAGLKWHWHQLRHTFACRWIEKGGTLKALSQLLGHASVRTTERYAKLSEAAVFAECERLALVNNTETCSKTQTSTEQKQEATA